MHVPGILNGAVACIMASGPSFTQAQADLVRDRFFTIAVNDVGLEGRGYAPWADVLYACDYEWWRYYEGAPNFKGQKWTQAQIVDGKCNAVQAQFAEQYGLHCVASVDGIGMSFDPECIHTGGNSGFQALNLAVLMGAGTILLLGYDMSAPNGKRHFFGDHPPKLDRRGEFASWIKKFEPIPAQLDAVGIRVINCTPESNLPYFEKAKLEELICHSQKLS